MVVGNLSNDETYTLNLKDANPRRHVYTERRNWAIAVARDDIRKMHTGYRQRWPTRRLINGGE